jgi:hypothetical protein
MQQPFSLKFIEDRLNLLFEPVIGQQASKIAAYCRFDPELQFGQRTLSQKALLLSLTNGLLCTLAGFLPEPIVKLITREWAHVCI